MHQILTVVQFQLQQQWVVYLEHSGSRHFIEIINIEVVCCLILGSPRELRCLPHHTANETLLRDYNVHIGLNRHASLGAKHCIKHAEGFLVLAHILQTPRLLHEIFTLELY